MVRALRIDAPHVLGGNLHHGGIIGDGQGTDCLDPAKQLSPELVKTMTAAKLQVGVPAPIKFRGNDIIVDFHLGEDTVEVLASFGMGEAEIAAVLAAED